MHLTKKDQRLLLVLLGLVLFALVFFGLVRPLGEKQAALETQLSELVQEKEILLAHSQRQEDYLAEMRRIAELSSAALMRFPKDLRSEDLILYANELRESVGLEVGSILTQEAQPLLRLQLPADEDGEGPVRPVVIMETGLQLSCSFTYDQLKQLINYVNANPKQTGISLISVGYSGESGRLSGVVSISRYFQVTEDYNYIETPVPPILKGNPDPFRVRAANTD